MDSTSDDGIIIFYYPFRHPSGASNLFARMALWIVENSKYSIAVIDYSDGHMAKAFPGRAAILIKLLELNENHISAVYEIKGSIKVGHFVPGTRIPILPEAELFSQDKTQPILNLA